MHKVKKRLTEEHAQDIHKRYQAGEASATVGNALGVSKTSVVTLRNEHDIPVRKAGLTDAQKRQPIRLRSKGFTLQEIARQIEVSYCSIQRFIAAGSQQ